MNSSSSAVLSAILWLLLAPPAHAATIRVPADQPTIQAGIAAAVTGDVVLVAAGTYTGAGNVNLDLLGKAITVRSESGAAVTTIDGQNGARGFTILRGETSETVVDGFTLRRCATGVGDNSGGGAMLILFSSPTIQNCVFLENSTVNNVTIGGGGAISCRGSGAEIRDCLFRDNTVTTTSGFSDGHGAGLAAFASAIQVIDCTFDDNRSVHGDAGGVFIYPFADDGPRAPVSSSIRGCTFTNNQAGRDGGGLEIIGDVLVVSCIVTGNHAGRVGGGMMGGPGGAIEDCIITGNSAGLAGGGLYYEEGQVSGCVIAENSAGEYGGGCFGNPLHLISCTLVGNMAPAGSSVSSQGVTIENSILAFGGPGPAVDCRAGATLTCSDVYGHAGGDWVGCIASQLGQNGNIAADPQFCARPADLRLCVDSPCAPEQSACGLIGALGVGCAVCGATAVEPTTWGRIKAEIGGSR